MSEIIDKITIHDIETYRFTWIFFNFVYTERYLQDAFARDTSIALSAIVISSRDQSSVTVMFILVIRDKDIGSNCDTRIYSISATYISHVPIHRRKSPHTIAHSSLSYPRDSNNIAHHKGSPAIIAIAKNIRENPVKKFFINSKVKIKVSSK